jgi:hypothetical protein
MGADKIMNLLCPNCQKMITVPDQNAGQMMKCPLCAGTFTAPSLPASMASSPSGSPPLGSSMNPGNPGSNPGEGDIKSPAPETPPRWESAPGKAEPFASVTAGSLSRDYLHRYTIWISPRVVPWIGPVGLVLIFFLFFFPWRSLPAEVESVFKEHDIPITPSQSGWGKIFSPNVWLILYFLLYLVTLALAIATLLLNFKVIAAPPQLKPILPWRSAIVCVLALLGFLFLIFGAVGENFTTFWFGLTAWIQFAVFIGLALEYCLEYRGPNRPLPKIDILW